MDDAFNTDLKVLYFIKTAEMNTGRSDNLIDVVVLGRYGFSQVVIVERPSPCAGTIEDLFLRTECPELLPATLGDLLIRLHEFQTRLRKNDDPRYEFVEIESLDRLKRAYRLSFEKASREGELRSLVELFIESLMEMNSPRASCP